MEWLNAILAYLIATFPVVSAILAKLIVIMGTARMFLKPIQEFVTKIVALTKTQVDDVLWAKILASKPYRIFNAVLDYVLSIKLPTK